MVNLSIMIEYETMMLHTEEDYPSTYISKETNIDNLMEVLKFAFEEMLGWDPYQVRDYVTPELIDQLKLTKIVNKIDFPPELDRKRDLAYLAHLLYPDLIPYDRRAKVLHVYDEVLSGKLKRFKKNFFITPRSTAGITNFGICLNYAINQRTAMHDTGEMYAYFKDDHRGNWFLRTVGLSGAYSDCGFADHLEMLHESMPQLPGGDMYYMYERFNKEMEQEKKKSHEGRHIRQRHTS